jgi:hypothetical protein
MRSENGTLRGDEERSTTARRYICFHNQDKRRNPQAKKTVESHVQKGIAGQNLNQGYILTSDEKMIHLYIEDNDADTDLDS